MRITIVGAGSVGTHLAKYLSGERMDIFIIDKDAGKLAMLPSNNKEIGSISMGKKNQHLDISMKCQSFTHRN
ncbi:MAG: NAD-binding protein [Prevotella sp.]|nr:NAD-binding protein [Prevotella sp.]MBO4658673.1 NAD-binding protein [Prevotella sp.]